jgi:hypothetical protein
LLLLLDGDGPVYGASWSLWKRFLESSGFLDGNLYAGPMWGGLGVPGEPETPQADLRWVPPKILDYYTDLAHQRFMSQLESLKEQIFADDFLCAVKSVASGISHYRLDIHPGYKGHRAAGAPTITSTNQLLTPLRKRLIAEGTAVGAHGCEADDFIRVWAEEARAAGDPFIVSSKDKDLHCIEGTHFDLTLNGILNIGKLEALKNLYKQYLSGDSTDAIPGIPGVGPAKAEKLVKDCTTEAELQEAVVDAYIKKFGFENWYNELLMTVRLITPLENFREPISIRQWPVVSSLL